jgi:hypothetical protein
MEVSIMVAVKEFSWEEVSAPDFGNPARVAWREAVAEIAEKAKQTLPECNGRVESAVKIVLAGDVELLDDGKAKVASQSNGTTTYFVVNGTCECRDFANAPSHWCKHRIAAGMQKRAHALAKAKLNGTPPDDEAVEAEAPVQPPATLLALPEAPASCNVYVELAGAQGASDPPRQRRRAPALAVGCAASALSGGGGRGRQRASVGCPAGRLVCHAPDADETAGVGRLQPQDR